MHAGRKEIVTFFYLYAIIELLAIFLDSGIIPTSSPVYPVSTAFLYFIHILGHRPSEPLFAGRSDGGSV